MALILLAGALTRLPALDAPPLLDDYIHISMIEGTLGGARSPFNLYDLVNDGNRHALLERGLLPWWSHPDLTIRYLRPLASALRWAEHRAFGPRPLLFHLHSLGWWVAAVLAAFVLYRRVLGLRPALFATTILALAPCSVLPLGWLANRELLVSLACGTAGLAAYVRWRADGRLGAAACAAGLFTLALLAGEYALGFAGYVLVLELDRRGEGLWRRALASLPYAAPAAVYLGVRAWLRYGTVGSAFYLDPVREPLAFLRVAPERFLRLLADEWLTLDTSENGALPSWLVLALVLGGLALVLGPLRRAFAALPVEARRAGRWLLVGSLLALLPVLAIVPSPRLLGVSMLGAAAAVALLLDYAWFALADGSGRRQRLTGAAALALGFAHLVHGPAASFIAARELRQGATVFADSTAILGARLRASDHADVVVVRGMGGAPFGAFALESRGVTPGRWRILSQVPHVFVQRTGARTLELAAPPGQAVYPTGPNNPHRNELRPFRVGAEVRVAGITVTVLEVAAPGPRHIRVTFDSDLEDASRVWVHETRDGLRVADLPAVGSGALSAP